MSIEALQSAAYAAGYAMVVDDDAQSERVYTLDAVRDVSHQNTSLVLWSASPLSADARPTAQISEQMHAAWSWVTARWANGAPA